MGTRTVRLNEEIALDEERRSAAVGRGVCFPEPEAENGKLKRIYADLALENTALKDLIEKSSEAAGEAGGRGVPGHGA